MGRAFWLISGAAAGLMAIAAVAPFVAGWAFDTAEHGGVFRFDAYGTWLQGSLTPIAILAALVGVGIQVRAQQASNRLAALGLVAANAEALANHLNYKAAAAMRNERLPAHGVAGHDPMWFVQQIAADPALAPRGPLRNELVRDLDALIGMTEAQGATFLLDYRLIQLRDALRGR